ncbi:uncharacterized protein [Dendrobates tinctorius]
MDRDRDQIVEKILHLTLEILFRLTGEDYTVLKKPSSERCQAPVSEGWGRPLSPITGTTLHLLIHEDINDQKILELTYKMIELLTGEVPIRCQDVAIYLSMEEWEYLEEHKDLYKDVMMEVPQPLTSVLSSKKTTPERCPRPLLPQDCKQEDPDVPQDHQGEDSTHNNTTEMYVRGDERCKEEIPTYDYPGDRNRSSERQVTSSISKSDDLEITHDITEVNAIILDIPTSLHSKDLSSDPGKQILSSASSQTVKKKKCHKRRVRNRSDFTAKKQISSSKYGKNFKNSLVLLQKFHTEEKRFSCSQCGKYFNQKSKLVKHERIHTGEKPYSCSECGKCWSDKAKFTRHQRTHTGEKPFSCSECGKCFADKSNLIAHLRNHTGKKPFLCSECGKCFNWESSLISHRRSHTGEKPFSCSQCEKCFNHKSNLVRHQMVHTGENPYLCSECGKRFKQKFILARHQTIHTGEKPFSCSKCDKCFNLKSNLVRHQRSHKGKKTYLCSKCEKCFTHKSQLLKHEKSHIEEKPVSYLEEVN